MRLEKPVSLLLQMNVATMAKNAVGSLQYRNFYVEFADGKVEDIFENGQLSCASFVSNLLAGFGLIDTGHATTESTVRALEKAGWTVVRGDALPADVLVWASDVAAWDTARGSESGDVLVKQALENDTEYNHPHIGIYIGDGRAVSNSEKQGVPVEHDWLMVENRELVEIWRYDFAKHDSR